MAARPCYDAKMSVGAGLIIGAALVAGAIAISHRYEIQAHGCAANGGNCSRVWRIDQWTGDMMLCEHLPAGIGSLYPACVKPTIEPPQQ